MLSSGTQGGREYRGVGMISDGDGCRDGGAGRGTLEGRKGRDMV